MDRKWYRQPEFPIIIEDCNKEIIRRNPHKDTESYSRHQDLMKLKRRKNNKRKYLQ